MRCALWLLACGLVLSGCVSPNGYAVGSWKLDPKSVAGQGPADDSLATIKLTYNGVAVMEGLEEVQGAFSVKGSMVTIVLPREGVPKQIQPDPKDPSELTTLHETLSEDGQTLSSVIGGNSFVFLRQE